MAASSRSTKGIVIRSWGCCDGCKTGCGELLCGNNTPKCHLVEDLISGMAVAFVAMPLSPGVPTVMRICSSLDGISRLSSHALIEPFQAQQGVFESSPETSNPVLLILKSSALPTLPSPDVHENKMSNTYKLFIQLDMLANVVMKKALGREGRPVAVVGRLRILRVPVLLFRGSDSSRDGVKGICVSALNSDPHNLLTWL